MWAGWVSLQSSNQLGEECSGSRTFLYTKCGHSAKYKHLIYEIVYIMHTECTIRFSCPTSSLFIPM